MSARPPLRRLLRQSVIRIRLLRSANASPPPTQCHVSDDVASQTPTSPEHKIPAMLTCPPAPKKARPATDLIGCKRKLDFFEINGRDEIESFFKESFESIDVKKKQRN